MDSNRPTADAQEQPAGVDARAFAPAPDPPFSSGPGAREMTVDEVAEMWRQRALIAENDLARATMLPDLNDHTPYAVAAYFSDRLAALLEQMESVNHDGSGVKSRHFSLAITQVEWAFLRMNYLVRFHKVQTASAVPAGPR